MINLFSNRVTLIRITHKDKHISYYVHEATDPTIFHLKFINGKSVTYIYNVQREVQQLQEHLAVGKLGVLWEKGIKKIEIFAPPHSTIIHTKPEQPGLYNKLKTLLRRNT